MVTDPKITEKIKDTFYRIRGWTARERALMGVDSLAGIREHLAIELDEVRESAAPAAAAIPDFTAHRAAYFCASRTVPDYARPTDAQIDCLARLSAAAAERATFTGRLTRKAAENLINDYRA